MLSKSLFVHGCQCQLRLWNEVHRPDLGSAPEPSTQALVEQGRQVGELARQRYPGGRMAASFPSGSGQALAETAALVRDGAVTGLFEATFVFGGVLVRPDVLVRDPQANWSLVEVKAASTCKPAYDLDLALQAWVLRGAGLAIVSAEVLTLDTSYVYDGQTLDLDGLFRLHERTEDVGAMEVEIGPLVKAQLAVAASPEPPAVAPGRHCFEPNPCPFYAHCTQGVVAPDHPVTDLPRLSRLQRQTLEAAGHTRITELPEAFELTDLQRRVRDCVVADRAWASPELQAALEAFPLPIHYLDFETCSTAIPRYSGMHPFQRLPFQWSCHHEDGTGLLTHSEFLPVDGRDPREGFARSMLATLGTQGAICVYSGFEASVIRELAAQLPDLGKALLALIPRLVDLLQIVRAHYYHPEFHGSFSIKRVLPVLVPGMDYGALAIRQGDVASQAYLELCSSKDLARRTRVRQDLLDYCRMDTLAMVAIRQALLKE